MTLAEAMKKAEAESRNGYVQHVNRTYNPNRPKEENFYVSDWYDSSTVASFENGVRL